MSSSRRCAVAIAELGYRPWKGRLRPAATRWLVIARFGIAAQFKSKALRRFLIVAWAPVLYFGGAFFAVGWFTENMDQMGGIAFGFIRSLAGPLAYLFMQDPSAAREGIWSMLFYYFFNTTQTFITMIIVAIAGPTLLSQDVRGKAFLLYFSRPITRWEYLLGKCSIVGFFIFMTTLFPATVLYAISIAFSPDLAVVGETFWVFGRSILASLVIAIPCTLVVLYLSSIVQESRWALIGWLAVWLIGEMVSGILGGFGSRDLEDLGVLLSLRENILTVCQHIFDVPATLEAVRGFDPDMDRFLKSFMPDRSPWPSLAVLVGVSLACFIGIVRRISAPLRA